MAQKISDINWDWVESHIADDPIKLRLKKDAAEHLLDIVQIECRKKAGKKLDSTLEQNPRFIFGNTLAAEQSTSDMLAQYHASLIPRGCNVCDLTSGLGIDVLHLVRRASSVTAIELQEDLCQALEINAQADPAASGKVRVICGDCRDGLTDLCDGSKKDEKPFDVIFIDPARRSSTGKRLFSLNDCQPDVVEMILLIRQACDTLIIKMSPMLDITQVCRELPCVSKIIVLGTNRECKELIAVCRWDKPQDEEVEISVVSLSPCQCREEGRNAEGRGVESLEILGYVKDKHIGLAGEQGDIKGASGVEEPPKGKGCVKCEGCVKGNLNTRGVVKNIPDSEGLVAGNLNSEDSRSIQERGENKAIFAESVPSDKGEAEVSADYLYSGSTIIKVNKFSFYPNEESSVRGVKYVDSQFIQSWMRTLDENLSESGSSVIKKASKDAKGNKKGMRRSHSLDKCDLHEPVRWDQETPIKDGDFDDELNGEDREADLKGENLDEAQALYLYEPSPSMMKAGAFQLLAQRFSLMKVGANSNLYLSDKLKEYFPGTIWKVVRIYPLNSSTIKALAKQNLKGEVAVRNYPREAEALGKKLKISSGVGYRYMATTTGDGQTYLFELTPVD